MFMQEKEQIIHFANSTQQDLDVSGENFSVESVESLLVDLGFYYGEEQESDGVVYSQFHHDSLESITIKKRINRNNFELVKD